MTRDQIERIEGELNRIRRLSEKTVGWIDEATQKGYADFASYLMEKNAKYLAQISSIEFVLDTLDYFAKLSIKDGQGYYNIVAFD